MSIPAGFKGVNGRSSGIQRRPKIVFIGSVINEILNLGLVYLGKRFRRFQGISAGFMGFKKALGAFRKLLQRIRQPLNPTGTSLHNFLKPSLNLKMKI